MKDSKVVKIIDFKEKKKTLEREQAIKNIIKSAEKLNW